LTSTSYRLGASIRLAHVLAVPGSAEKSRIDEDFEKPAAGRFIEPQEALCLPARQTQARHFQELAVDPLEHEVAHGLARMSAHDLPSPLKRASRRPLSNGTGE
jgi:hypothetical protein